MEKERGKEMRTNVEVNSATCPELDPTEFTWDRHNIAPSVLDDMSARITVNGIIICPRNLEPIGWTKLNTIRPNTKGRRAVMFLSSDGHQFWRNISDYTYLIQQKEHKRWSS